jgi:hypothetical protein
LIVAERHRLKILDRRVLLRPSNALLFAFERGAALFAFERCAATITVDVKREGMTQRVCRDRHPLQAGTLGEAGDNGLDRAHGHRRISAADEQRRIFVLARSLAFFLMLPEARRAVAFRGI